jgi:hypothetical protein
MKKTLFLFLILLSYATISKPGNLIFQAVSFKPVDSAPVNRSVIQKHKTFDPPFQGKKTFCSYGSKAKYIVIVKANNVVITSGKKQYKGVFKAGKLFTNDPEEIEYRKYAGKYNYGKFYVLGTDYFSVLNAENGEYSYYTVCR